MTNATQPPANSGEGLDIETEILKVSSLVAAARRLLADNKMVDLSALSGKVMTLCEAINLEAPTGKTGKKTGKIISAVDGISGDLDRLAEELTSQHKGVHDMFQDASPSQMISAYNKARDES